MAKKTMTFGAAMDKAPKKAWEAARNAEPGGKRELPDIDDGVYPCRIKKAKGATDKNGNPYVVFTMIVLEGEFEGVTLEKFHSIKDWDTDMERLVKTVKGIGYQIPDKTPPGTVMEEIIADINETQPEVMTSVENDTYEAKADGNGYKKGDSIRTLNVYINRPRSVEEGAAAAPASKPKTTKKAPAKKTAAKR